MARNRKYQTTGARFAPALRAFLLARYPSLPDADNLVQECLVRVLRAHEREPVLSPRGLLFATARNLALDGLHPTHHLCRCC